MFGMYGWFQDLFNPSAVDAAAKAATGGSAVDSTQQKNQQKLIILGVVAVSAVALYYLVKSK